MRTTQATRYARWSAILAILLACFVGGSYLRHAWQVHLARAFAPSAVPSAIQQQAAEFSFSKVDGDHAEFTVRASHATEFAEGGRSLLQDVWVTFYGQDGSRSDNLHTRSCELLNNSGNIICAGDVQIDLQSADDAKQFPGAPQRPNPGAHIAHITTSHVSFDRDSGITASDQPVKFDFPSGYGTAVGLRYDSHQEELQLMHNVDINFQPPAQPAAAAPAAPEPGANASPFAASSDAGRQPLHLTAASLDYRRQQRTIDLVGPVNAEQGVRLLVAGHLAVDLDADMHARRLIASAKPKVTTREQQGEDIVITAEQFAVLLAPQGWINKISAIGSVRSEAHSDTRVDRLDAARTDIEMTPGKNQPHSLTASQDVLARSDGPAGISRQLSTSRLDLQFADAGDGQLHVSSATTPEATVEWHVPADRAAKTPGERMHLSTQHLDAAFGPDNNVREVHGTSGVAIERQIGSGDPQTSTSRELTARLDPSGNWSTLDLNGEVALHQLDQIARADLAHFDHNSDTATLKGSVTLSNPHYRLTTRSATFAQQSNEFRAEGDVVSSEIAAPDDTKPGKAPEAKNVSVTNLGDGPARISANHLLLNTETGHAIYSEQARLWQGNALIEADRIELDRTAQSLTANGHVRAVFPQQPMMVKPMMAKGDLASKPKSQKSSSPAASQNKTAAGPDKSDKTEYVRTEAGHLIYRSQEGRAFLDQGVISRSVEGSMQSDAMNLYFADTTKEGDDPSPQAGTPRVIAAVSDPPADRPRGPQQLVRATALGHVQVLEEDRRASANQVDYTSADGKFVLSGGAPTVRDTSGNSASGRQLTLFFADDRIVIDSAEGTRTLTLHRVEK